MNNLVEKNLSPFEVGTPSMPLDDYFELNTEITHLIDTDITELIDAEIAGVDETINEADETNEVDEITNLTLNFQSIKPVVNESERTNPNHFKLATHLYGNMKMVNRLGYGSYGDVYSGEYDGNIYAIKRNFREQGTLDFCGSIKEMDILGKLNGHPYIIQLCEIVLESPYIKGEEPEPKSLHLLKSYETDPIRFIFERADYDLYSVFNRPDRNFSLIKKLMVQMLLATEFMHGKGIIHRDIKPSNILILKKKNKETGEIEKIIKICDFGLAKPYDNVCPQTPRVVTCWYRPLEIVYVWTDYGTNVDIWSLGQVFLEMIRKQPLLSGTPDEDIPLANAIWRRHPDKPTPDLITRINKENKNIPIDKIQAFRERANWEQQLNLNSADEKLFNGTRGTTKQFITLLKGMLSIDPNKRWTATKCLETSFFDSFRDLIANTRNNFPPYP